MNRENSVRGWSRIVRPFAALVALAVCGCASVGPKTISRDQFDYGGAIGSAQKEQLLSNIVGLRYVDAPIFVNVSSVINQYSLEGEVSLGAGANTGLTGQNTLNLGGAARWADRPTITYTPVTGQKFAQSLLTPIPPESLFALIQAGWPAEIIFRLTVRSINALNNEWASPASRRQADPEFVELMQAWPRLRNARAIGMRREADDGPSRILVYQNAETQPPEVQRDVEFFHESLGLDPDADTYRMAYGLVPANRQEIRVMTTSLLEIMNELAWRMEAPEDHIQEERTGTTFRGENPDLPPLIRIQSSEEQPEDTYVAIRNRDRWFYIDDRDVRSKRIFAILQLMFSLTDTGDAARGPVVTIGG